MKYLIFMFCIILPSALSYAAKKTKNTAKSTASIKQPNPEAKILDQVLQTLQKTYENTQSFSGEFVQKYYSKLLRRTDTQNGLVKYSKLGKIRWDYAKPKKMFLVNGNTLWIFQPEHKQAFVNKCFNQDMLTASLAFLLGKGQLSKEFNARLLSKDSEQITRLLLIPKEKNHAYKKLILFLDKTTFRVIESIVIDPLGNQNSFSFNQIKFNVKFAPNVFNFVPPKGIYASPMPGSCSKNTK